MLGAITAKYVILGGVVISVTSFLFGFGVSKYSDAKEISRLEENIKINEEKVGVLESSIITLDKDKALLKMSLKEQNEQILKESENSAKIQKEAMEEVNEVNKRFDTLKHQILEKNKRIHIAPIPAELKGEIRDELIECRQAVELINVFENEIK